ncbi:MAG: roadblock/LC7 domain-containing protein [Euryarchaeota archaeon]|nr:roadblock/LC7 domain-containing protein [Euryarchaeota archaeon]
MLQRLLATFGRIGGVQAAAVVDADSVAIATYLTPDLKEVDIALHIHDALRETQRVVSESGLGNLDQFWVESENGNVILAPLAGGFTLYVSSLDASNIGRLRHEVRARAPVIEDLLR